MPRSGIAGSYGSSIFTPGVLLPHSSHNHTCTHIHASTCILTHAHMHKHMNTHGYTLIHAHYMCAYMPACMDTHAHLYTHAHTNADIHEYTCTHSHMHSQPVLTPHHTQPRCTCSSHLWLPPHLHWPCSHFLLSFSSEANSPVKCTTP